MDVFAERLRATSAVEGHVPWPLVTLLGLFPCTLHPRFVQLTLRKLTPLKFQEQFRTRKVTLLKERG